MPMNWLSRILDCIAPRQCAVCGRRLAPTERSLCAVCTLHLPRTTYQFTPDDNPMARLFWGLMPVERAAALMFYEPHAELANLIYKLKYGQRPDIGEDLGRLMAREMLLGRFFDGIDVLIPVPLARKRMRQRGYNQSMALAQGISEITALPIADKAIRRTHFRQSQTSLNRQDRHQNVADLFQLVDGEQLQSKHILFIDDICTTGATLTACMEAVKDVKGIKMSVLTLGFTKK